MSQANQKIAADLKAMIDSDGWRFVAQSVAEDIAVLETNILTAEVTSLEELRRAQIRLAEKKAFLELPIQLFSYYITPSTDPTEDKYE